MTAMTGQALWLFDLGNTRLKGRWSHARQTGLPVGMDWDSPELAHELESTLAGWPEPERVLVASVASGQRAAYLRDALRRWPDARIEWLSSPRRGCGITNAYRVPARLGIDRFLAMAGARAASGGAPFVIVGCGTALTLDAVDAEGNQQQGLIAPSPDLMMRSLRAGTAIADTNPDAFTGPANEDPDDTGRAIRGGCRDAAVALIESFHARHRRLLGAQRLWLHGGGAPALQAALDAQGAVSARLLDDAVWRGLEVWASSPSPGAATPA
ncbi:MAG TPA: type III pantothenate kinase [Rhodanobacteraceae bacterium]|nr:type III pantothenate kinase [Rhodanobacteraceae bacterium]